MQVKLHFSVMMDLALLAFMIVIMTIPNWISEIKADEASARFAGKENIRSALLKLTSKENASRDSETHPSIHARVKHIDEMKI
jgi:Zn-dependent protease with chaperone function